MCPKNREIIAEDVIGIIYNYLGGGLLINQVTFINDLGSKACSSVFINAYNYSYCSSYYYYCVY